MELQRPGHAYVRIQVEAVPERRANLGRSPDRWAAVGGKIVETSPASVDLEPGDEVLGYTELADECGKGEQLIDLPASRVFPKPQPMSYEEATGISIEHVVAAVILQNQLGLQVPSLPSQALNHDGGFENQRVLILGGETNLGLALVQTLHLMEPRCSIIVTISMEDQYSLLQRAVHLVSLGSRYAIDGEAAELMDHLRADSGETKGVDVVLDITCMASRRTEIHELLRGRKRYVDCRTLDLDHAMSTLLGNPQPDLMSRFENMLHKAAEAFQIITEPSCDFSETSA